MSKLPSQIDRMLSLTNQGGLRMRMDDPDGNQQLSHISRSVNRLTLAILSASLLVTSAIYLSSARHAAHVGLGIAAIFAGIVVGLIALFHVLRPGRV
jgi:cellobiose-specific phosphotransferase system component IIC